MRYLVIVIVGIFLFQFLKQSWKKNSAGVKLSDGSSEDKEALDNIIEMEEAFFEAAHLGKRIIKFMYLFYQKDIVMIRSLFQSENIPYRMENEHISHLLVGTGGVGGINHTSFYILEDDYDDAIKIIKKYVEDTLCNNLSDDKIESEKKVKQTINFVSALHFNPKIANTSDIVIFKLED